MEKHIPKVDDSDLERLRREVLEWIEKNEMRKSSIKQDIRKERMVKKNTQTVRASVLPNTVGVKAVAGHERKKRYIQQQMSRLASRFFVKLKFPHGTFSSAKKWLWIKKPIVAGLVIAACYTALIAFFIYGFGWHSSLTRVSAKLIPFPAVSIDGTHVLYWDFMKTYDELQKLYVGSFQNFLWLKNTDSLSHVTTRYYVMHQLAQKNGIRLGENEIFEAYEYSIRAMGGNDAFEKKLKDINMSPENYLEYVIIPELLMQKLSLSYKKNNPLWKEDFASAENIRNDIVEGKLTFSDALSLYGNDITSRYNEFIYFNTLPGTIQRGIANLNVGDISQVIDSEDGFYIIRLTDSFPEFYLVRLDVVRIKGKYNFSDFLSTYIDEQKVTILIPLD